MHFLSATSIGVRRLRFMIGHLGGVEALDSRQAAPVGSKAASPPHPHARRLPRDGGVALVTCISNGSRPPLVSQVAWAVARGGH